MEGSFCCKNILSQKLCSTFCPRFGDSEASPREIRAGSKGKRALPEITMAMTRSAWAERELMMCCWMRNWATSTMLLKDRFRIFSAQSQVKAQAASILSLIHI